MKFDRIAMNTLTTSCLKIGERNAYHQAGYAAAIYMGNQQKKLPAVHFQIVITAQECADKSTNRLLKKSIQYTAKIEGGRLIQSLPLSIAETARDFSPLEQAQYRNAFEADIINLLAGSLAEAKYVALRDNEVFNANLVYLGGLKFYSGKEDLDAINEYMECFMLKKIEQEQKLAELFLAAYCFINNRSNWNAISHLAEFIRDQPYPIIRCENVISILESFYEAAPCRPLPPLASLFARS